MCFPSAKTPTPPVFTPPPPPPPPAATPPDPIAQSDAAPAAQAIARGGRNSLVNPLNVAIGGSPDATGLNIPS